MIKPARPIELNESYLFPKEDANKRHILIIVALTIEGENEHM